jgi:hypothetical protein
MLSEKYAVSFWQPELWVVRQNILLIVLIISPFLDFQMMGFISTYIVILIQFKTNTKQDNRK